MRTGSVLMEFLFVLPLYFTLIGGTFAVGELLYKASLLSVADRVKALTPENDALPMGYVTKDMFPVTFYDDDERQISRASTLLQISSRTFRVDEKFRGSWSWQSAAQVRALHAPPPWSRGWISSAVGFFDRVTQTDGAKNRIQKGLETAQSLVAEVVPIAAMERTERRYDSYVLVRTLAGRGGYRTWKPKNMVHVPVDFGALTWSDAVPIWGAPWFKYVYREPFASSNPASLDALTEDQGADRSPNQPGWRTDYARFPTFMLWSQ